MNVARPLRAVSRLLYSFFLRCRLHLPRQQCLSFMLSSKHEPVGISSIGVINLDRQPDRWRAVHRELGHIVDGGHNCLSSRVIRYPACDAQTNHDERSDANDIAAFYTLGDQLYVEPQPEAHPEIFDLERRIRMTEEEIAVARSHVSAWREIARSESQYSLVLEDDVYFDHNFGRLVDKAWREMEVRDCGNPMFDILYLSYKEVRHGAPKTVISQTVFRPERGLWCLSGYVLSKKGAQNLIDLLPCRGPVDLWINHKFRELDVRALRRSVIHQRLDIGSTNSYSILPILSRIGIINNSDAALFRRLPIQSPVFVFGTPSARLSSLAMALSMLGYRCCSDLDRIPECELKSLLAGHADRVFNAYVNVDSLISHIPALRGRYPDAKFILVGDMSKPVNPRNRNALYALEGPNVLRLSDEKRISWPPLCEHLQIAPPSAAFPNILEIGCRRLREPALHSPTTASSKDLRHDDSPWVAKRRVGWPGINVDSEDPPSESTAQILVSFADSFASLQPERWVLRNDTFPGNLSLFRPANVALHPGGGVSLTVIEDLLAVRNFSAAAVSSRPRFLYGRFEVMLQASNVPGVVTGFFLHRDSPRQEIDVEITGNRPNRLLANVFYNPGAEGARFDYGYRGTPVSVPLEFDASNALHRFAIEWYPHEIRWLVDDNLVHRRATWNPTPIPHLPMTLHVNTWPTRSRELAGRLSVRALPASTIVRQVTVHAFDADGSKCCHEVRDCRVSESESPALDERRTRRV